MPFFTARLKGILELIESAKKSQRPGEPIKKAIAEIDDHLHYRDRELPEMEREFVFLRTDLTAYEKELKGAIEALERYEDIMGAKRMVSTAESLDPMIKLRISQMTKKGKLLDKELK